MAPFCACQQTFRHCFYVRPWARLGDSLSHWSCQSDIRASCKATANQQAPAVEDPPATFSSPSRDQAFLWPWVVENAYAQAIATP